MDGFSLIGASSITTRVIILAFKHEPFVKHAYITVRALQAKKRISRKIDPCVLPYESGMSINDFYLLWLFMPSGVDVREMANVLLSVLKQRLGVELINKEMPLELQITYAKAYEVIKRQQF